MKKCVKSINWTRPYKVIFIWVFILIIGYMMHIDSTITGRAITDLNQNIRTGIIEESNFVTIYNIENILESQNIVKGLPKNAMVNLIIVDYSKESPVEVLTLKITKEDVNSGSYETPDLTLTIDKEKMQELNDICSNIKTLKDHKNSNYQQHANILSLMFKYRKMYRFKNCLEE